MQQFSRGTNTVAVDPVFDPTKDLSANKFDLEEILPLETVREHTKTDDVPAVSDTMLRLYRKAAFEAAQEYTGILLSGQRIITEDVTPPVSTYRGRGASTFRYDLRHPVTGNYIWYYGLKSQPPEKVSVVPGSTRVNLPRRYDDFGMGCCNPCTDTATARIMYSAGLDCIDNIPAAILLGVLKYIAHVVENPGDIVIAETASGGKSRGGAGSVETSNPAWASGAIEIWRSVVKDAI